MYQQLNPTTKSPLPLRIAWGRTWLAAVARPSRSTYERIAGDVAAGLGPALVWVFVSALLASLLSTLASLLFRPSELAYLDAGLIVAIPALAVLSTLSWLAFSGCSFLFGRWLGGTGTCGGLAYSYAACSAPLGIALSVIAVIPGIGWLSLAAYGYWLALLVMAAAAVHCVTLWRALFAVVGAVLTVALLSGALLLALVWLNRSLV